ncbi:MAG: vitamin B12-dependent ribonucleotide reductase, partial [Chitinophagaceae bacterium]
MKKLQFNRHFSQEGITPFDQFEYELRTSEIKDPNGENVFREENVEVPTSWSQIATDILAQKYFRKAGVPQPNGSLGKETSVKQVVHRMANCWKVWGIKYGYFETEKDAQIFYEELVYSMLAQQAAPNSPQWFNTGLYESYHIKGKPQGHYYVDPIDKKTKKSTSAYERPQPHACFILSVNDDLVNEGGIMDLWLREARVFKYGSGVGTNFSNLRGTNEILSGGGASSGLMSFLKIGDRSAGAIKSGGTTRRAAKMVCLDLDHPEIIDFIEWKMQEEKKVKALIEAGYSNHFEGEAYNTVSGQNSNNSVRIPNLFFSTLRNKGMWDLTARTDHKTIHSIPAQELWDKISNSAWHCADPGVQFSTTINEWHTCPKGGSINASNPCSEYMFLDNTACNLASLNLVKFFDVKTQQFNTESFQYACRLWTVVLEISVLMAQFPSKEIAELSYQYRTIGLGYANLGTLLMLQGIPYDTPKARSIAASITAIMTGCSYSTSAEMASFLGSFEQYEENKEDMLRVISNHRVAAYNDKNAYQSLSILPQGIDALQAPNDLLKTAQRTWDKALTLGQKYGYRNAQATVIAPTGTIGLIMDCDTTGVEPDFALVKFKKLAGGGYFKIVNQAVTVALHHLGYTNAEVKDIIDYIVGHASLENSPFINPKSLQEKGFTKIEISTINQQLKSAFDIKFVFNSFVLGDACMQRLGFSKEEYTNPSFNMLEALEFTTQQIEQANDFVCGTMMIEQAPHIKQEHLPIFETANKCGKKGKRYIKAAGHICMMAAVQPFISGAISKTINLPNEATVEDVANTYLLSWQMGLKANALYRDGSKHSQPLSNKVEEKEKKEDSLESDIMIDLSKLSLEELLQEIDHRMQSVESIAALKKSLAHIINKRKLPAKRNGFTQKVKINSQSMYIRTGEYNDATIG